MLNDFHDDFILPLNGLHSVEYRPDAFIQIAAQHILHMHTQSMIKIVGEWKEKEERVSEDLQSVKLLLYILHG